MQKTWQPGFAAPYYVSKEPASSSAAPAARGIRRRDGDGHFEFAIFVGVFESKRRQRDHSAMPKSDGASWNVLSQRDGAEHDEFSEVCIHEQPTWSGDLQNR